MIAVDTNVLVLAHRGEDPRHALAVAALQALAAGDRPWGVPAPCVTEALRVLTHPRFARPPHGLSQATGSLRSLLAAPSARLLLPLPGFVEVLFESLLEARATGNLVFDAQIVAVCRQHGVRAILSEDRDMRRFGGVEPVELAAYVEHVGR